MTKMAEIYAVCESMTKEFGRPYGTGGWGGGASGNTYTFTVAGGVWGPGKTIAKSSSKTQLLRAMEIYREGLRDALYCRHSVI